MSTADLFSSAHQFRPACLTVARSYRGLKKKELAERVGITPSAITQLESGDIKPNAQTLARLSMALGFPASFFAQSEDFRAISVEQCHFRSLRSASLHSRLQMIGAGALIDHVVRLLERYVDFPVQQVSEVVLAGASTAEDIEAAATAIRRHWGLADGPIEDVVQLFESKGIVVSRLLDDCEKLDAFSTWHRGRPFIFLSANKAAASRSRFDASHELGHLILHADALPGDKRHEIEAHQFASSFLMPQPTFAMEFPRRIHWPYLMELKRRWGVSLAAMIRRARDLDLITPDTYRRAFLHLNQNGWRTSEPHEPALEQPRLLGESVQLLLASGLGFETIAQRLKLPPALLENLVFSDGSRTLPFTWHEQGKA